MTGICFLNFVVSLRFYLHGDSVRYTYCYFVFLFTSLFICLLISLLFVCICLFVSLCLIFICLFMCVLYFNLLLSSVCNNLSVNVFLHRFYAFINLLRVIHLFIYLFSYLLFILFTFPLNLIIIFWLFLSLFSYLLYAYLCMYLIIA